MLDWDDLRFFLAVARTGSTLAAAKVLRVNQSTVQRRLTRLEHELKNTLVERLATGYRLTPFGLGLCPYAEAVEMAVQTFEINGLRSANALDTVIRLTCASTIGHRLLAAGLLERFHARYPQFRIQLVLGDRFLRLASGEADLAIRAGAAGDENLLGKKIAEVPWAVFGSRSYVARHPPPSKPQDLNKHAIIAFSGEVESHQAASWIKSVAPRATIAARGNDIPSILLAVKSGAGLAPLPEPLAGQQPELIRLIGPIQEIRSHIFLLTPRNLRRTVRVSAFFNFVNAEIHAFRAALLASDQEALRKS
jgi:DNA-binding transcriptional LysR family regulator